MGALRPLIAVILGAVIVSACSTAGPPSASPITSAPSPSTGSVAPALSDPPSIVPPTAALSPTPTSDANAVALADVAIRPIATRPPGSGCTADDLAPRNLDRAMTFADTPIAYGFQSGAPRDGGPGGWSDGVPGPAIRFDSSDKHQTVDGPAGSVVRLAPAPTITLTDGRLELYRLDANDHAGDGEPVAMVALGGDARGLDVPLPTQAGRWLLNVYTTWQTDCANGDGYLDLLLITT